MEKIDVVWLPMRHMSTIFKWSGRKKLVCRNKIHPLGLATLRQKKDNHFKIDNNWLLKNICLGSYSLNNCCILYDIKLKIPAAAYSSSENNFPPVFTLSKFSWCSWWSFLWTLMSIKTIKKMFLFHNFT